MLARDGETVSIIVTASDSQTAARAVEQFGGTLTSDLWLINVVAATVPANRVTALAAVSGVQSIVANKGVESADGPNWDGYATSARVLELELAITSVARGETYLSPAASQHVVGAMRHPEGESDALKRLTPRQLKVLQLIAQGECRKSIALKLNISPKTVDAFRAQLMRELDLHDIASLIRYAIKMGLVNAK